MTKIRFPSLTVYYAVLVILLYLPIGVLFLFSINDGVALTFPLQGLTGHWYQDMLKNTELLHAVGNSALVALSSSFGAAVLGTAASIALVRFNFRGKSLMLVVALMPLLVPFLILGVALLVLFSAFNIPRSLETVAVAHAVVSLPYALLIIMARLVGFDPHLEEAAQDLGASYLVTLWRIVIPIIAPAVVAAWMVAFTISFDEYVLASFLNGGQATLPVYIFGQLRFANRFPQVVALAVVVMTMSITLFLLAERLQSLGTGTARSSEA